MGRRLAAPKIIIVHRRQVVMAERVGMDALDGSRYSRRPLAGNAKKRTGLQHKKCPEALTATERCIPHSLRHAALRASRRRQQGVETRFDEADGLAERLSERHLARFGVQIHPETTQDSRARGP